MLLWHNYVSLQHEIIGINIIEMENENKYKLILIILMFTGIIFDFSLMLSFLLSFLLFVPFIMNDGIMENMVNGILDDEESKYKAAIGLLIYFISVIMMNNFLDVIF